MFFCKKTFRKFFAKVAFCALSLAALMLPISAFAGDFLDSMIDGLDMSPFVPIVLDAFLTVASGVYEYFVGNGDGIIYVLIWGFLAISIGIYLVAMYAPKKWTDFLGIKTGGEMWKGTKVENIVERVLKTSLRALIAATILLQIKPVFLTEWFVNPFLEVGSYYTAAITNVTEDPNRKIVECPQSIVRDEWLSKRSCEFLAQPIADLSRTNNQVIKRGFDYMAMGFGESVIPFVGIGSSIMSLLTGAFLIITFVSCNIFMALLIIQGIFNFGMALILYPFHVLGWVAKDSEKYVDVWPAFANIITALKQLLVTMVACAFILIINIAIVKSLFSWDSSAFAVGIGGVAPTSVSSVVISATNYGEHFVVWLSSIMTMFLMVSIFNITRKQIEAYAPGQTKLYDSVVGDTKVSFVKAKSIFTNVKNIVKKVKKK